MLYLLCSYSLVSHLKVKWFESRVWRGKAVGSYWGRGVWRWGSCRKLLGRDVEMGRL